MNKFKRGLIFLSHRLSPWEVYVLGNAIVLLFDPAFAWAVVVLYFALIILTVKLVHSLAQSPKNLP
jgi:hypothetical protein